MSICTGSPVREFNCKQACSMGIMCNQTCQHMLNASSSDARVAELLITPGITIDSSVKHASVTTSDSAGRASVPVTVSKNQNSVHGLFPIISGNGLKIVSHNVNRFIKRYTISVKNP